MNIEILDAFAEKSGKDIAYVKKLYSDTKKDLMKEVSPKDESFLPLTIEIVKKKLGIETSVLDQFKNWIKGE